MNENNFRSLQLPEALIAALERMNIVSPTPVQLETIPRMLAGEDLIVRSQTGTGKTLAYLLPVMSRIDADSNRLQAVVLAPTHELVMQIVRTANALAGESGISALPLIGGASLARQIERLKAKPQLVVGTPARIAELIGMKRLSMHYVRTIVVDEADLAMESGFAQEVEKVLASALRDRQLAFFSATVTKKVRALAEKWMRRPVEIDLAAASVPESLTHYCFVCKRRDKIDMTRRLVRHFNPSAALVFVNEIEPLAEIAAKLNDVGLTADILYGEAGGQERAQTLERFRAGKFQLLIATEVAARGLDLPDVTHVINFDFPPDAERYVHRAGRTGRMGRSGHVLSLATEADLPLVKQIAGRLGIVVSFKRLYAGRLLDADVPARPPIPISRGADAAEQRREAGNGSELRKPTGPRKPMEPGKRTELRKGAEPNHGSLTDHRSLPDKRSEPDKRPEMGRRGADKPQSGGGQALSAKRKRREERERDRKNKGAPRWLKAKQREDS